MNLPDRERSSVHIPNKTPAIIVMVNSGKANLVGMHTQYLENCFLFGITERKIDDLIVSLAE